MHAPMQMAVTTSRHVSAATVTHARLRAHQWDAVFVDRADRPLHALTTRFDAVLVYEEERVRLADSFGDIVFHPGMAYQRIRRHDLGAGDRLVDLGRIRPGHRVLDATLGFGQDALVAAWAAGPSGRVVGLEQNRALFAFAHDGLGTCELPACVGWNVADRIDVRHADARVWLDRTDETFDLIVLDPMFANPKKAQPGFDLLRRHAADTKVDDTLLKAALAKARTVVVKVGSPDELAQLSIPAERIQVSRTTTWARFIGFADRALARPST